VSEMWSMYLLVGLAAGILSASFGLGSGIIMVPAGVLILSMSQKSAQGTALAVMVPMALVGALLYWRDPDIEVNLRVVGLLASGLPYGFCISAVFGAVFGAVFHACLAHKRRAQSTREQAPQG